MWYGACCYESWHLYNELFNRFGFITTFRTVLYLLIIKYFCCFLDHRPTFWMVWRHPRLQSGPNAWRISTLWMHRKIKGTMSSSMYNYLCLTSDFYIVKRWTISNISICMLNRRIFFSRLSWNSEASASEFIENIINDSNCKYIVIYYPSVRYLATALPTYFDIRLTFLSGWYLLCHWAVENKLWGCILQYSNTFIVYIPPYSYGLHNCLELL